MSKKTGPQRWRAEIRERVAQTVVADCLEGMRQETAEQKDVFFLQIMMYLGWSYYEIMGSLRETDVSQGEALPSD